jgi:hypothetical protein
MEELDGSTFDDGQALHDKADETSAPTLVSRGILEALSLITLHYSSNIYFSTFA